MLDRTHVARFWNEQADVLTEDFQRVFWQGDHFAEYLHPEHGLVDHHALRMSTGPPSRSM